uniref:Uncharacterized protein n=1 Tax=Poecilia mexicana TaxID=48701 RepID=A0A3B3XFG0_9TELE
DCMKMNLKLTKELNCARVGCSAEQFTFGKMYVFPFRHKAEMCPFIDSYDHGLKPHRETHASNHFTCKVHRLPLSDHNRAISTLSTRLPWL